jgi:hypothetical protein
MRPIDQNGEEGIKYEREDPLDPVNMETKDTKA